MKTERALFLWMSIALAACADANTKADVETETHFLHWCESSCGAGLSCICGVCTRACTSDTACEALDDGASCAAAPDACGGIAASGCDVECTSSDDCAALSGNFECAEGRCRMTTGGDGGQGGAGGSDDAGASGSGGQSGGQGGAGGSGGGGGDLSDAGSIDGGSAGAGGDGSVIDNPCDTLGEECCDPFPLDGPNFCTNARLICGAGNTCEVNCGCVLGAYIPVCGVDGQSYDATCGNECVPMEIACAGECPCEEGHCAVACTGAAPDQEVVDACQAIGGQAACQSYESGGFPTGCRWVTPSTASCPAVP